MANERLTKKEVIRIWTPSSDLEDLDEIEELAMYIPNHCYRCLHMYHITLLHQQLFGLRTYCFDDGFGEEILFVQAFYTFIKIDRC